MKDETFLYIRRAEMKPDVYKAHLQEAKNEVILGI